MPASLGVDESRAVALLVAFAFLPALGFLVWVRAHERRNREPLAPVLGIFLYGATLGVLLALVLATVLDNSLGGSALLAAVVAAPLVEELTKGLGLGFVRRHIDEPEDGIVYGVAVGVGFAATETLLYGLGQLNEATLLSAIGLVLLRNVTSLLLHASSSALLGFGYARVRLAGGAWPHLLPSYLVAVLLHAVYNGLVLTRVWLGFLAALVLVVVVVTALRRHVRRLDAAPGQLP